MAHDSSNPRTKPSRAAGWQTCKNKGLAAYSKQAGVARQAGSGLTLQHQQSHAIPFLAQALPALALAVGQGVPRKTLQHLHHL